MKATADMYTYRVFWSGEDGAFVASVSEFPSLSNVADSQKEALNGLSELVADALADMRESGEQPPVPLGCRTYSGKYALRMTPEQHRRVVMEAAEQGVVLGHVVLDFFGVLAEGGRNQFREHGIGIYHDRNSL